MTVKMQTLIIIAVCLVAFAAFGFRYFVDSTSDPVFDHALIQSNGNIKVAIKSLGHVIENENGQIINVILERTLPRNRKRPLLLNNGVLKQLSKFGSIETLVINTPNNMTDAGMVHVAKLQNLQRLNITLVKITDRGLQHLATLQNLRHLSVDSKLLSDKAISDFEKSNPNCYLQCFRFRQDVTP